MNAIRFRWWTLALVIEALMLALRRLGDLRGRIPETVGLLLLTSIFYLVSCHLILKIPSSVNSRHISRLAILIAAAALVFRFTLWPMFPSTSDDPFRYRWEGKLQASAGNPYQARPNDLQWAQLKDATFPRVVGKDFKAAYGPLLELFERWNYQVTACLFRDLYKQVFWFKFPAALFDLGVITALWALLSARGLPTERILIYAWSPLPILEFWATGHNDSVAIFFVLLALLASARERWWWAFVALTLAAAAKIWPLVLFPIFIGWKGWRPLRWYQWLAALPVAGLLAWPYWSNVEENVRFVSGFLGGWRNNDSLYGFLLWLTGDQYPAKYTAFAIVGAATLLLTLLQCPLEKAAVWTIVVMLMVSANCHPWYLTWILPLLAFVPLASLFLWTALVPLSYEVVIGWALLGEWHGSTPSRWLIYVPVYGLLLGEGLIAGWRRITEP